MEYTDFTIRLIIILIPWIISTLIVESITIHKKWTPFRFIISSILLGIISFVILQLLYWLIQLFQVCKDDFVFKNLHIWDAIIKKDNDVHLIEILFCLPLSLIIEYIISYIIQSKRIFKIAQALKVSNKFGDDSLYYHYLNRNNVDWVYIRDIKNGLTYLGQVDSWAEDENNKELSLRKVTVYNYSDSKELYKIDEVYLNFCNRDIIIEEPKY